MNAIDRLADGRDELNREMAEVVDKAITHVLDGEPSLDALEACEKTYIGTKVEKRFLHRFALPKKLRGSTQKLDTVICGIDVDLKFTLGKNWMIPPEAVGQWCLLVQADYPRRTINYGVLRMDEEHLTKGGNRDRKRSVSKEGKKAIAWMGLGISLPDPKDRSHEDEFARIAFDLGTRFETQPDHPFDAVESAPQGSGVYALKLNGHLKYIGKAIASGGLRSRLRQHQTKLMQARLIDMRHMSFQYLECSESLATGLEDWLIGRWGSPWNGSGFGSKAAGSGRPHQKRADWDIEFDRADPARASIGA